jgi:signal transduction histidine kinase
MADNLKKDVLLVDDEPGIRKVLRIALEDSGFRVFTAADARQALELFSIHAPPVVVTDIKMPGMDGIDLLKQLKAANPDVAVIMITGHGDLDLAIESLKLEATDFITKPIHDEALDIAMKRAWESLTLKRQLRAYTENLEQLVEEKTRRLVEAERLAAVGETVAGLSHAIKNISGGLSGGSFVLEQGLELDNKQYLQDGWRMLKKNIDRITDLSIDLLDYAKADSLHYRSCNPNDSLTEIAQLMAERARAAGVAIRVDPAPKLAPVVCDPDAVHRCLLNLVTNALEACGEAEPCSEPRTIRLQSLPVDGGGVEFRVTDDCGGMDQATLAKIFSPFFSTKGRSGTGIGLMLTKKIVDKHGGVITVQSTKGETTVFTLKLPEHPAEQRTFSSD